MVEEGSDDVGGCDGTTDVIGGWFVGPSPGAVFEVEITPLGRKGD